MRQLEDPDYAQMLFRIRLGIPTENDIEKLIERVIHEHKTLQEKIRRSVYYFDRIRVNVSSILCLMPTNSLIEEFNARMIEFLDLTIVEILAIDSNRPIRNLAAAQKAAKEKSIKPETRKFKHHEAAGLETNLKISCGARIMLRRNIDIGSGLVNGALGTIIKINYSEKEVNLIENLEIKFDNMNENTKIERITADFECGKNTYMSRTQFPIHLAWAITIHKCQGLTLDAVLLDIGVEVFELGMSYVALSRAKLLKNVHLLEFDPIRLQCNGESIKAYNILYTRANLPERCIKYYNVIPVKYQRIVDNPKFKMNMNKILNNDKLSVESNKIEANEKRSSKRKSKSKDSFILKTPSSKKNKPNDTGTNAVESPRLRNNRENQNIDLNSVRIRIIDQIRLVNENKYALKLCNRGENSCYSNAIIQCLLSLGLEFFVLVIICHLILTN
jgi:hypothetical protein